MPLGTGTAGKPTSFGAVARCSRSRRGSPNRAQVTAGQVPSVCDHDFPDLLDLPCLARTIRGGPTRVAVCVTPSFWNRVVALAYLGSDRRIRNAVGRQTAQFKEHLFQSSGSPQDEHFAFRHS